MAAPVMAVETRRLIAAPLRIDMWFFLSGVVWSLISDWTLRGAGVKPPDQGKSCYRLGIAAPAIGEPPPVACPASRWRIGYQTLREFQDNEKTNPTILTTSQKLSTGVEARNERSCGDSRSAVHLETNVALVGDQRLACIDPDAHADRTIAQPVADLG